MNKIDHLLLLLLVLVFSSCRDDDDTNESQSLEGDVLIVNEGNFGFGNASIGLYNSTDGNIIQKVFQQENEGRPIGDVVQSAIQIEDRIFIVVNNSNKIEVINRSNFEFVGDIQNLNSPRYILPVGPNKAYVSDLFEDKIYTIDLQTLSVTSTIATGGWTEEMILVNNQAFVCHVDSHQVWVIDVNTDQVVHKFNTHEQPQHIEKDRDGMLWVSCSGGLSEGVAALYKINPNSLQVENILSPLDTIKKLSEIEMNANGDEILYLSSGDLFRVGIQDTILPDIPLVNGNDALFYGLAVDDRTDEIYVIDAIDFLQRGVIFRYNQQGTQLSFFKGGIIPGDLLFLK